MGLQDFIYSLELGNLRRWMIVGLLMLAVVSTGLLFLNQRFQGASSITAFDQLQLAREICRGEGFRTKFLRPAALWQMSQDLKVSPDELPVESLPDSVNAPLYPLVLAAFWKLTAEDFAAPSGQELRWFNNRWKPEVKAAFFNLMCLMGAALAVFVWMYRMFDLRVALLGMGLTLLSQTLWDGAIGLTGISWLILVVCLFGLVLNEAFIAQSNDYDGVAVAWFVGAGALLGFCVLSRYVMAMLMAPLVLFGFLVFRWRWVAGLAGPLATGLVCLPWLLRNREETGAWFGSAWIQMFAHNHPNRGPEGDLIWRIYQPIEALHFPFKRVFGGLVDAMMVQLGMLPLLMGGVVIVVLAAGCIFHVFRMDHVRWNQWFWILGFVVVLAAQAAYFPAESPHRIEEMNVLIVFLPVAAGLGGAFLFVMASRFLSGGNFIRTLLVSSVCLVQGAVLFMTLGLSFVRAADPVFPPYHAGLMFYLKETIIEKVTREGELHVSDLAEAGAWYYDRPVLWLPRNLEEMNRIHDTVRPLGSLILSPAASRGSLYDLTSRYRVNGEFHEWNRLILAAAASEVESQVPTRGLRLDTSPYQRVLQEVSPLPVHIMLPYGFWLFSRRVP